MDEFDLESICPQLRKFVWEVANARPGVGIEPIKVRNLRSGRNSAASSSSSSVNDRFTLLIPYCGNQLNWDVIFLWDHPKLPPDFYFKDDNFLKDADCDLIKKEIPSLANWDPTDHKALLNVIIEFLNHYKIYQLQLIPGNHRAFGELGMLLSEPGWVNDMEILHDGDSVKALIILPTGLRMLDGCKTIFSLQFDGRSDKVRSNLKVYGKSRFWDDHDNLYNDIFYNNKSLILDVLPEAQKKIENFCESKLKIIARRKQIVLQFVVDFKSSIVEFDAIDYTFVVLHLSRDNFRFFLKIDLRSFPEKDPQYRLISNYCFKDTNSFDRVEYPITNVRYHNHMSPQMVVDAFFGRFHEVFNNFKKNSISLFEKNLDSLRM